MKCKFCGEDINENDIRCASCGGELERITDPEENLKIIDEMPELHDELDKIGVERKKSGGIKKRVIVAAAIVLVCLLGSFIGMYIVKNQEPVEPVNEEVIPVSSAVPGSMVKITEGQGFTDVLVTDELSAETAINSLKARLGITDERTSYRLKSKINVGTDTYYRFGQFLNGIMVYDGEMVIMADENGTPLMINGTYVDTQGLDLSADVTKGSASNGVIEYINKLPKDYCLQEGVSVSEPEKVVCNYNESTYLAYMFKVSGYNENGEFTAYDVFVDADAGNGICYYSTVNYENQNDVAENPEVIAETVPETVIREAAQAPATYFTVNDKFNWNDETKTSAIDEISLESINAGETSAYISDAKAKVDRAYTYFNDNFLWNGLDGQGLGLKVYINANEYVENELPPEKAIYSGGVITLIEEDLINGKVHQNVVAHEYAHGVMQNIAYLSGTTALTENSVISEGYADVFGELAEIYFTGSADWVHGERDIGTPVAPYLDSLREDVGVGNISSVYYNSTIISHALCKMYVSGMDDKLLGEVMFRTVCMMNKNTTLSEWRTITEMTLNQMMNKGVITNELYAKTCDILASTGISSEKLYAGIVEELPASEVFEENIIE